MPRVILFCYAAIMAVMSLTAIGAYGWDKLLAKRGEGKRIKEKTLFFVTVYGGAVGAAIGSIMFRHKTKKGYFTFIIALSLIVQISALIVLILHFRGVV